MSQLSTVGSVHTTVARDDGITRVVYHATTVVEFDENVIILKTGGWFTNTTKTRMNQTSNQFGLGYSVYQKDFDWFVNFKGETIPFVGTMMLLHRN